MATSPRVDEEWDAGDLGCGELVLELRWRLEAAEAKLGAIAQAARLLRRA